MTIGWTKNLKQSKICWIFYFWKFEEVKKPCVRHLDHGKACSKLSLIKRKPHNFPSPLYIYIYIYTHIHTIVSGITFLKFNPNQIDQKWSILLLKKKKKKEEKKEKGQLGPWFRHVISENLTNTENLDI